MPTPLPVVTDTVVQTERQGVSHKITAFFSMLFSWSGERFPLMPSAQKSHGKRIPERGGDTIGLLITRGAQAGEHGLAECLDLLFWADKGLKRH